jgi:electron transfer flavoprotein alpha subunit
MAGDVTGITFSERRELLFRRPMHAGATVATVTLAGRSAHHHGSRLRVRPAEPLAVPGDRDGWPVDAGSLPNQIEYVSLESRPTGRPELTEARVVVSGGRPFRSAEEFEDHVGGLADA